MDEILLKLDRIERMLYTLLNNEEKEKIKNEKIKKLKEKADKYQQLFEETCQIEKSDK